MSYITHQQWFRIESFRRALTVGLGVQLLAAPAILAQDNAGAAPTDEVKKVIITGSLIPTAETVGVAPVDVIRAEAIEKTGASDVLELVKRLTPSFSGNVNVGQEVNNGGFGESNVAIRNLPTLVLLNGRRLGNSSFSNGTFVDVNAVPLAAVERVEILKDGASALYGSEAIGGVVNIITKRNYSGVEIGGRYGVATQDGDFTEQRATLVFGTGNERSSITAAAQYYHRDALATSDRPLASMGRDELASNDIEPSSVSYMSPSFPGKVQDGTGSYLLRGSPLMALYRPSDYNPSITTPPPIPNGGGGFKVFSGPNAVSDYNNDPYWASQGLPTPYAPINGSFLLNTTTFGTHTIQEQSKRNVYVAGDHQLFDKQVVLYADFLYANIDSQGRLAPSPVTGLGSKQSNIDIPANNVHNPFGINLGPVGGEGGLPPGGPRIRSRFVDSGNRVFDATSDYYHFVGGLKGDWDSGWGYDAGYTYNRYDQTQFTRNAINGAALDLALRPNNNPALAAQGLSQLPGSSGSPVPMYNIFAVGGNDPETVRAVSTTLFQSGRSEQWDAGGRLYGRPFRLPGGDFAFSAGGGFSSESLANDFDGLTRIGKVPGLNAALPTSGRRDSWAGFIEAQIPITSPDNDIIALHSLEVTAAGRYETFDPGGDAAVPKLGIRWQPFDKQLTIRGNYSESFVAPTTFELFGGDAVNVPAIVLPTDSTGDDFTVLQEYTVNRSNPNLVASDAKSWGAGFVYSPEFAKRLTISADYYHIKQENAVFRIPEQTMVDDLNALGSASQYRNNFFRADGSQLTTEAPNQVLDADWGTLIAPLANGAEIETDGIDLTAIYRLPTETAGDFSFYAAATILLSYDYTDPFSGKFSYEGQYSDPNTADPGGQGTLPDYQINAGMSWEFHNFTTSVNARYIPPTPTASGQFFTVSGNPWEVDSWYAIDMQVGYGFRSESGRKWFDGIRLAVGCNNITDNEAPLIASAFEDNTDKSTYDIIGRFVYFEVSKKF